MVKHIKHLKSIVLIIGILMISTGFYTLFDNSNVNVSNPLSASPSNTIVNDLSLSLGNISYKNYSLPHFNLAHWIGYAYDINAPLQPIFSRHNPFHNAGFYFINLTNQLVFYDIQNNITYPLHSFTPLYEDPGDILPVYYTFGFLQTYQNPNGSLQFIYIEGSNTNSTSADYSLEIYNLYNNTFKYVNTSIVLVNHGMLLMVDNYGWIINDGGEGTTQSIFNYYSMASYSIDSGIAFIGADHNSPNIVQGMNTIIDQTSASGDGIYNILAFNTSSLTFTYNSMNSGESFSADYNNQPMYYQYNTNGTATEFGLFDTSGTSYNTYSNMKILIVNSTASKDRYITLNNFYWAIGDGEFMTNNVVQTQSGYAPQGAFTFGSSIPPAYLFINLSRPAPGSYPYYPALDSNYTWLNDVVQNITKGSNGQADLLQSATYNGYEYAYYRTSPTLTNYFNNYNTTVYWLTNKTTEFINTAVKPIQTYKLDIKESGLNANTQWSYTFNNNNYVLTNTSYNYSLANGSYAFTVSSVSGYTLNSYISPIVINGANVIEYVNFTKIINPTYYKLQILENGLPSNTEWTFTLSGINYNVNNDSYNFSLTNGTYTFSVNILTGYSVSYKSPIVINGANKIEYVNFTINVIKYTVKFAEYGLPSGANWYILIDGQYYNSTTSTIIIFLVNGYYSYSVQTVLNFTASYNSAFTVNGQNQTLFITFTANSNQLAFYNYFIQYLPEILIGLFILGLLVVGAISRRR